MAEPLASAPPLPTPDARWHGIGLSVALCPHATIWQLEGPRDIVRASSLPRPGRCLAHESGLVLCIGPDVYLHLGAGADIDAWRAGFRAVIEMSSAWTHLAVEGPHAIGLLRKGCAVDLHPRVFSAGACAATGMARMRVVLWRPGVDSRYELLVGRSYALSLWSWLMEAAEEYGGEREKEGVR